MDRPHALGSAAGALQAKGVETVAIIASRESVAAGDFDRGKPVGAVVAAVKVLRTLHASERPLNASEVARAAALHRGTAYNILRTLQAEGFVAYDEATRTYSVSLHILEIAHGVLRHSGLMDLARPLMHAVSDTYGVSVYLSKVVGPCSQLLLDWVGAALRTDLYLTVGRQFPGPRGASGVIMAAFGNTGEAELAQLVELVEAGNARADDDRIEIQARLWPPPFPPPFAGEGQGGGGNCRRSVHAVFPPPRNRSNHPRRSSRRLSESRAAADCMARLSGPTASLSMSCECAAAVKTSSRSHDGDRIGTDTWVMP